MILLAPVSVGEWIDKLTILEIKLEEISDARKCDNVRREYEALREVAPVSLPRAEEIAGLRAQLKVVNQKLWHVEDYLRERERSRNFDCGFVALAARSISQTTVAPN